MKLPRPDPEFPDPGLDALIDDIEAFENQPQPEEPDQ